MKELPTAQIEGFRLSPHQRRAWLRQGGEPPRVGRIIVRLGGPLDEEKLRSAVASLLRHEALRTRFVRAPGVRLPFQVVDDEGRVDWRRLESAGGDPVVRLDAEAMTPFDLESGPVLRGCLLSVRPEEHLLAISAPILCADGASLDTLLRELLLTAFHQGEMTQEPLQYAQFSEWQHQLLEDPSNAPGVVFWRRFDPAERAFDLPLARSAKGSASLAAHDLPLPPELMAAAAGRAAELGASPADVLLAAWQILLWRLTGRPRLLVGCFHTGRKYEELIDGVGLYARWLPLASHCDTGVPFHVMVRQAVSAVADADEWHACYVEELAADGSPVPFSAGFSWERVPDLPGCPGLTMSLALRRADLESCTAALAFSEGRNGLRGDLLSDPGRLDPGQPELLAQRYAALLARFVADPALPVERGDLLTPDERSRLLIDFCPPRRAYPRDSTVIQLIEQQVESGPRRTAAVCGAQSLSYDDLDGLANRLAHRLRRSYVEPGTVVGVLLERSIEFLVAVFGIGKAGGAFLPIDPGQPRERLELILADAGASLVITRHSLAALLPEGVRSIALDTEREVLLSERSDRPASKAEPESLAYVLYTSGSTGRPKGVMVHHRALANYLVWAAGAYAISTGSGAPVHSSVGFDLTLTALLGPLVAGSTVTLLPAEPALEELIRLLQGNGGFSFLKLTPSHLRLLALSLTPEEKARAATCLVVGGEALSADSVEIWRRQAPAVHIFNEYGPTETTVGCCVHELLPSEACAGSIPIGRPIANTRVYVLDGALQLVPEGIPGELFVGGDGVAQGYLGRPDLTAERFVPDPTCDEPGARVYRTGDLARYLPERVLEFLGRVDEQIKVRGYRIEPGEIEAALGAHPQLRQAAIALWAPAPDDQRLVAYVVPSGSSQVPTLGELREFLARRLPEYMLPSVLVKLAAMPLSKNGKIDRQALPAPDAERPDQRASFVAPETEAEVEIAGLWKRLLHLDRIGIDDNFFDLGGHSLLALQALAEMRAHLGVELSLQELFAMPTVRAFAARVEEELMRLPGGDLDRLLDRFEAMDEVEAERLLDEGRREAGQEDR